MMHCTMAFTKQVFPIFLSPRSDIAVSPVIAILNFRAKSYIPHKLLIKFLLTQLLYFV